MKNLFHGLSSFSFSSSSFDWFSGHNITTTAAVTTRRLLRMIMFLVVVGSTLVGRCRSWILLSSRSSRSRSSSRLVRHQLYSQQQHQHTCATPSSFATQEPQLWQALVQSTQGSWQRFGELVYHDTLSLTSSTSSTSSSSSSSTSSPTPFRVVFILGGPGSGKGTQCSLLQQYYPHLVQHCSVGDLLRREQDRLDSPYRDWLPRTLAAGRIVPVHVSLTLLRNAMHAATTTATTATHGRQGYVLVDGFPRNFDNLKGWIQYMMMMTTMMKEQKDEHDDSNKHENDTRATTTTTTTTTTPSPIASIAAVLVYTCPLEVLTQRILQRSIEAPGRSDDNLETLQKRFRTFEQDTVPVIDTLAAAAAAAAHHNEACASAPTSTTTSTTSTTTTMTNTTTSTWNVHVIAGNQSIPDVWSETQDVLHHLIRNDVITANAALLQAIQHHNVPAYRALCDGAL